MTPLGTLLGEIAALIPALEYIPGTPLGLVYSPDTLDNGSQIPTSVAHKNATISFPEETRQQNTRDVAIDTVQIDLLWQLPIPHADGAEQAREAEIAIISAVESLVSAVCVTLRHDRSLRRYHPKSRGWWLTTLTFSTLREK